jgi:hypothetical protein
MSFSKRQEGIVKIIEGQITKPHRVSEDTLLRGMITEKVTVAEGVRLEIRGMITADLEVGPSATVLIYGMVNGTVRNLGGHVVIEGWVDEVVEGLGGKTEVKGEGMVRGRWGGPLR